MIIDDNTSVSSITWGQLKTLINKPTYVYGIEGIMSLFNVCQKTASVYAKTIIKDAVMQRGRTIVVDADKAMRLFADKKNK